MSNPEKILANSICPGCAGAIDPDLNRCANCGYVHMARLDRTAVEPRPEPARTLACPRCAAINTIYNEKHNVCFSCHRVMYRLPSEAAPDSPHAPRRPKVKVETTSRKAPQTTKVKVDSAFKKFWWWAGAIAVLIFIVAAGGIFFFLAVAAVAAVAVLVLALYGVFLFFGFTFSWISRGR